MIQALDELRRLILNPDDIVVYEWANDRPIYRLGKPEHSRGSIFHPGHNVNPTRFAPIVDSQGNPVPYLYGGGSLRCALFETVFHNVPFGMAQAYVSLLDWMPCAVWTLHLKENLRLVDLTSRGLRRIGVSPVELIYSLPEHYERTAAWAQALHQLDPSLDGLLWMSRHDSETPCVILYGEAAKAKIAWISLSQPLSLAPGLRDQIIKEGYNAGITVE